MAGELEAILEEMKTKGIAGAIIRVDGILVQSTLAISESTAGLVAAVSNNSDALMKQLGDKQKQIQLSLSDSLLVMVPVQNYVFCGMVKNQDDKKLVVEYAEKAKQYLTD